MQAIAETKDMDRQKWLEMRRRGIGGSDAPAILGVHPWKTAMDVWLEKTGEFTAQEDNERMYWGRVLEDIIAKEFARRTGLKIRRRNAILRHPRLPWMIANVDRLIAGEKAGLEIKTAGVHMADDWQNGIPEYYYAQVQHYMAVTGYSLWWVAVLIGGQEMKIYKAPRDAEYIKDLIAEEENFWDLVERKVPPPIDGTKASTELVKRRYPVAEKGKEIELPFEAYELIRQYEEACEQEKKIQLLKDEAANKLKDMLKDAEVGMIYDRKVIWKNVVSQRLDTKALQQNDPDIYKKYLVESQTRRFSVK